MRYARVYRLYKRSANRRVLVRSLFHVRIDDRWRPVIFFRSDRARNNWLQLACGDTKVIITENLIGAYTEDALNTR